MKHSGVLHGVTMTFKMTFIVKVVKLSPALDFFFVKKQSSFVGANQVFVCFKKTLRQHLVKLRMFGVRLVKTDDLKYDRNRGQV